MNHAFIIQVHQFPNLLRRSLKIMEAPNHYFFVHIDSKCDKLPFEKELLEIKNVIIINNIGEGGRVNHAGFSQIECTLKMLRIVIDSDIPFDYIHSISGQDFPLCNIKEFDRYFIENPRGGWMHYDTFLEHQKWSIPHGKYEQRYMRHYFIDEYHNEKIWKIHFFAYKIIQKIERYVYLRKRLPMEVFAGWSWFTWSKNVTEFVLEYLSNHPEYLKRFKQTSCCDELIFHTMLHPYLKNLDIVSDNSLRYIIWHPKRAYSSLPLILEDSEFKEMTESKAMFCRKVHPVISAKLLNHIENYVSLT